MSYKWVILLCIVPALTMVMLDYTIVNVALATFGAVFGVGVATVGWAVTGFALVKWTPLSRQLDEQLKVDRPPFKSSWSWS